MACMRARWVAAWVLDQGKSGPGGKYWTSSFMYLPEGNVMPAYSTWQPTAGRIPTTANPVQRAIFRPRARRDDLGRGVCIMGTLLGSVWTTRRGGPHRDAFGRWQRILPQARRR